mmetsp:Transcript_132827/g.331380  ORF Transcript_132827/g.331380 Transcript_132827/m.331380 type:complete len:91 (-) Transcript_132827:247-519(-)
MHWTWQHPRQASGLKWLVVWLPGRARASGDQAPDVLRQRSSLQGLRSSWLGQATQLLRHRLEIASYAGALSATLACILVATPSCVQLVPT